MKPLLANLITRRPRLLWLLIALDLFWTVAATIYDWPKIVATPWHLLLFMPICPIYPLLLAIAYLWSWYRRRIPAPLAVFAFLGSLSYGLMAYIFYPLMMSWVGWDWLMVGNMLWVTFYALQVFLLLPYLRLSYGGILAISSYFFLKDFLDFTALRFSYFITATTPPHIKLHSFIAILLIHVGLMFWLFLHNTPPARSAVAKTKPNR